MFRPSLELPSSSPSAVVEPWLSSSIHWGLLIALPVVLFFKTLVRGTFCLLF